MSQTRPPAQLPRALQRRVGRRLFLGGAATATLAAGLPALESLKKPASAQSAPQRIVFVTVGHSIQPAQELGWTASQSGPMSSLPSLLSPLAEFRDRITLVKGIHNVVAQLVSSNGHNASSRTLLTCMPHQAAIDGGGNLIANAPELGVPDDAAGPSIDYAMADALSATPLILRVGAENGEHRRNFRLDLTEEPGEPNPSDAFDALFGNIIVDDPTTLSPQQRLRRRRTTILRTVQRNYEGLAKRVGAEDRLRLEQHAALIESVIAEIEQVVQIVCTDPELALPTGLPSNFEDGDGRTDDVISQAQNSLIALTLACQATPVVSLHYSNIQTNKFPWLNNGSDYISDGWHGVIHHDVGTDQQRTDTVGWYHEALADLLRKLDAIPEGDGTLLDNTTVVFMSSLGNSAHSTNNIPVYIVSRPGGGLVTGEYFDLSSPRTTADLYVTLMNQLGISGNTFGWNQGVSPGGQPFNSGPISQLLT